YSTNNNWPNRAGLCGSGFARPESDHCDSRRFGSVPSQRFIFAIQRSPTLGTGLSVKSANELHGIATSRIQPRSLSEEWLSVPTRETHTFTPGRSYFLMMRCGNA